MKQLLNRLAVLFMMLLGVLPQIALLVESLELGVQPHLWLWLLALALCLWISACFHRGILLGMPGAALLLYEANRFLDAAPIKELDDAVDKFSGAYYLHYYDNAGSYTYLNAVEDHSFLLLLLACLLFAYLSSALTSRSGRRIMCLIGSVPLPAACLAVNGVPGYAVIVALLLFWSILMLSGNYEETGAEAKLVFGYSLPVLLLLCSVLLLCRPQDYEISDRDIELSQQFDRIGEWIRSWIDEHTSDSVLFLPGHESAPREESTPEAEALLWESANGSMDLTQSFSPDMLSRLFLRVRASEDGTLYLRGVSYGEYTGTGWAAAPEAPLSSLAYTAEALDGLAQERRLSLQYETELRYALLPYYCLLRSDRDAYLPSDGQTQISYLHYSGDPALLSGTNRAADAYDSFAREMYTRLPESTRQGMLSVARDAGLDASQPDLIDRVASFIRDSGTYDIATEAYPSDDYALYFLTQAHRGYCVHFATAATALYRALGIPARITEGFLAQGEKNQSVPVSGEDAHAWVEVYRDGLGWIPVEVTGRGGLHPLPEDQPEPDVTEEPVPAEPSMPDEPAETGGASEEKPADPLPVGVIQQAEASTGQAESLRKGPSYILRCVLLLLLLAAVPFLWRALLRQIWSVKLRNPRADRAAVALWKRSQQIARFGGDIPAEIQNCAEKAVFSESGITAEELAPCYGVLAAQAERQYQKLSTWKKLLFRYVYGLK